MKFTSQTVSFFEDNIKNWLNISHWRYAIKVKGSFTVKAISLRIYMGFFFSFFMLEVHGGMGLLEALDEFERNDQTQVFILLTGLRRNSIRRFLIFSILNIISDR